MDYDPKEWYIKEITVTNKRGLHIRPSTMLAEVASKYAETGIEMRLEKGNVVVDPRTLLDILKLEAEHKDKITLRVKKTGDYTAAAQAIADVFAKNFDEE